MNITSGYFSFSAAISTFFASISAWAFSAPLAVWSRYLRFAEIFTPFCDSSAFCPSMASSRAFTEAFNFFNGAPPMPSSWTSNLASCFRRSAVLAFSSSSLSCSTFKATSSSPMRELSSAPTFAAFSSWERLLVSSAAFCCSVSTSIFKFRMSLAIRARAFCASARARLEAFAVSRASMRDLFTLSSSFSRAFTSRPGPSAALFGAEEPRHMRPERGLPPPPDIVPLVSISCPMSVTARHRRPLLKATRLA